jgi:hypothetical protein
VSQKLFETNNRQIGDVKNIFKESEVNMGGLSETVRVIWDFKQLDKIVQTWGEKQLRKIYRKEEKRERDNIVIFEMRENRNKGTVIH